MLREKNGLLQMGLGLLAIGVVVKLSLYLVTILGGLVGYLASIAIAVGIVLAIVGLVVPGRR